VGVRWSGDGGQRQWCEFIALISTREGKRRDKVLSEDEAEAESSS
jgi:hypothetical protein